MNRKRALLHRLLAGATPDRDGARGFVSTRLDAEDVVEEYRAVHPSIPEDHVAVVDCVTDQRSTGFGDELDSTPTREYAHDPGDLTGIGIGVSGFMRRYHEAGLDFALGVHTLSTMLMYADVQRVYRFVHVLTRRTADANYRGAYVLDESAEDPGMLAQPFDGMVAVRETETGSEVRVRGVDAGPDEWTAMDSL